MRVEWIHPSWRDLVIDELAGDPAARQAFLAQADAEGLLLAISVGGGADGKRALPLLRADADFDLATTRFTTLLRDAEDHLAGRLLGALTEALPAVHGPPLLELTALAQAALDTSRRAWTASHRVLPLATLEAWLQVAHQIGDTRPTPAVATWAALEPAHPFADPNRAAEWIALATALHTWRPGELERLGFPLRYHRQLKELRVGATGAAEHPVWNEIAQRLRRLGLQDDLPPEARAPAEPAYPRLPRVQTIREADGAVRDIVDRILDDL